MNEVKESLMEIRDDMLLLKYFVDSRKLPEAFLGTALENKLISHKSHLLSEIESWLSLDAEIIGFFEQYENGKVSLRESIVMFVAFARREYATKKTRAISKTNRASC